MIVFSDNSVAYTVDANGNRVVDQKETQNIADRHKLQQEALNSALSRHPDKKAEHPNEFGTLTAPILFPDGHPLHPNPTAVETRGAFRKVDSLLDSRGQRVAGLMMEIERMVQGSGLAVDVSALSSRVNGLIQTSLNPHHGNAESANEVATTLATAARRGTLTPKEEYFSAVNQTMKLAASGFGDAGRQISSTADVALSAVGNLSGQLSILRDRLSAQNTLATDINSLQLLERLEQLQTQLGCLEGGIKDMSSSLEKSTPRVRRSERKEAA
ncbi:MAG: hypothetical protein DCC75_10905 [Proteobacteria bacterium]|nr:MAG: hypothetical protein DCC75_10905 [Pseudomonadota bacterium]